MNDSAFLLRPGKKKKKKKKKNDLQPSQLSSQKGKQTFYFFRPHAKTKQY